MKVGPWRGTGSLGPADGPQAKEEKEKVGGLGVELMVMVMVVECCISGVLFWSLMLLLVGFMVLVMKLLWC